MAPDREVTITVRFSFKAIADYNQIRSELGSLVDPSTLEPREPTASEMTKAFEMWKAKKLAEAKLSFRTGNALASDEKIEVTISP